MDIRAAQPEVTRFFAREGVWSGRGGAGWAPRNEVAAGAGLQDLVLVLGDRQDVSAASSGRTVVKYWSNTDQTVVK
jgi:hypothetical protein